MIHDIKEGRKQRKKAKNVLRYLAIPQAVHFQAADQINRPHKKRAARWATRTITKEGWVR